MADRARVAAVRLAVLAAMGETLMVTGWVQAADLSRYLGQGIATVPCDGADCRFVRDHWHETITMAEQGKVLGWRNIAFCLSTGCKGAVVANQHLACVWRIAMVATGEVDLVEQDVVAMKADCSSFLLSRNEQLLARAQAQALAGQLRQYARKGQGLSP